MAVLGCQLFQFRTRFLTRVDNLKKLSKNFKTLVDVRESPVMFPLAEGIDVRFLRFETPSLAIVLIFTPNFGEFAGIRGGFA